MRSKKWFDGWYNRVWDLIFVDEKLLFARWRSKWTKNRALSSLTKWRDETCTSRRCNSGQQIHRLSEDIPKKTKMLSLKNHIFRSLTKTEYFFVLEWFTDNFEATEQGRYWIRCEITELTEQSYRFGFLRLPHLCDTNLPFLDRMSRFASSTVSSIVSVSTTTKHKVEVDEEED